MLHLGVTIRCIQSDRGSEYFTQKGATYHNHDRAQHELRRVCSSNNIRHVLQHIEMKDKLAAAICSPLSRFLGRRGGLLQLPNQQDSKRALWPSYHTSLPCYGGTRSVGQVQVFFGSNVFLSIFQTMIFPKVPGIPRGRRLIFVGF